MRRNLSGIFISDQVEGERKAMCFEECQESTQDAWLASLNREELEYVAKLLGKTLKDIGDQMYLVREPAPVTEWPKEEE